MSVVYNKKNKTITLYTKNTSYQMKIGNLDYLLHLYYGRRISDPDLSWQVVQYDRGFSGNPYESRGQRTFSLDAQPQEYPTQQQGDFRITPIDVINADGSRCFNGRVKEIAIKKGKYSLTTLPTSFACSSDSVETLQITLEDEITHVQVILQYGVFEEADVITRCVTVVNGGDQPIHLQKIMSACLDFLNGSDKDLISFPGRYGQERQVERQPVTHHIHQIASCRGTSSHQQNPFVILCDRTATEDSGSCYGMTLMYSGNFLAETELDQYDQLRTLIGINPKNFSFSLQPGESFEGPEVIMAYSDRGLTGLTHLYHDFFRNNLCDSPFAKKKRPILINTWEATFFDFDDKKLLDIARNAKKMGVDLMVMDDGWFGRRNDDNSGLGDWFVNEEKIPCGLNKLVDQINRLGMHFGIWFEPEGISEDSDLYRSHPEWVLQIPGRPAVRSRNQLLLDLSQRQVQDYLIDTVNQILDSANIYYMKWDLNRSLTDLYSRALSSDRQGEVCHRYVLGLYRVMNGIIKTHPDILFEGCSGGGGRLDPAMMVWYPQYWTSDNTKPMDNLKLHYGTSFLYPISTIGAHVSEASPNVPLSTRACVAMCGTYGYELDATKLGTKEITECRKLSELYNRFYPLISYGDYYRLTNPFQGGNLCAWQSVSKDREESLISIVVTGLTVNGPQEYIRAKGLQEDWMYYVEGLDLTASGASLMYAGIPVPREVPEYSSFQYYLKHQSL